jgi:hypothetical protein
VFDAPAAPVERIVKVGGVASCVDVRRACFEALIDNDAVCDDEATAGKETDVGDDAYADDRDVGCDANAALGLDVLEPPVTGEARGLLCEHHLDAVLPVERRQFVAEVGGAELVDQARAAVDQRDFEAELAQ